MIDIVNAHCTPSSIDPTGKVAFGHIILQGKVLTGLLYYDREVLARTARIHIDQIDLRCALDIATWDAGPDFIAEGSTVKVLLMYGPHKPCRETNDSPNKNNWIFLVLKQRHAETYERIGIIFISRLWRAPCP
jgi:hypothetical protein